jgi:hypothetical protein
MFRTFVLAALAWAVFTFPLAASPTPTPPSSGAPSPPHDVQVVNQGGPNHSLTNYQALAWQPSVAGPNPVDHY